MKFSTHAIEVFERKIQKLRENIIKLLVETIKETQFLLHVLIKKHYPSRQKEF